MINPILSCEAILSVSKYTLGHFRGNLPELQKQLELTGRKMTAASGEFSSIPKMVITDLYGKATLTFSVYPDTFCLWAYRTGRHIGDYKDVPENLDEIIEKTSDGLFKCNNCGGWFDEDIAEYYSYAGVVCPKCFNPKIHAAPDTRGD
jgi:DNA-directed RNA polymerase subunit RPC12/RpoP